MAKHLRKRVDPFEEEWRRIQEEMEEMIEDVFSLHRRDEEMARRHSPYVYGFSMKITPQGAPAFTRFGNAPMRAVRTPSGEQEFHVSREPLIDVIEGEKELTVIAELPGVGKENVHLNATETSLTIEAFFHQKKYHRKIELPCEIIPDTSRAIYNNGVLEIKFKRRTPQVKKGKQIEIR